MQALLVKEFCSEFFCLNTKKIDDDESSFKILLKENENKKKKKKAKKIKTGAVNQIEGSFFSSMSVGRPCASISYTEAPPQLRD
jgi:hypothetical protein